MISAHTIVPTRPVQRAICAALAVAITAWTTQTIVRSAGQHEYGLSALPAAATVALAVARGRITVAQVR